MTLCYKLLIVIGIVGAVIGGIGYWYYTDSQETIKTLTENNVKLKSAIDAYETERATFKASIQKMTSINQELAQERNKLSTKVNELSSKFGKHDIGMLANRKPGLVERKINKAVKELNNEIESITSIPTE